MEDRMRVYISGAITGTDDYEERFEKAEQELLKRGFEVINPVKVNKNLPKTATHSEYMHISYALMDLCDAVYSMPGWKKSTGACMEFGYGVAKGKLGVTL